MTRVVHICMGQRLLESAGQSPPATQSDGNPRIPPGAKSRILVHNVINTGQFTGFAYDKKFERLIGMCVCDTTQHLKYIISTQMILRSYVKILIPQFKCCVVSHTHIPMSRSNL